jgi:hypothetical protein
MYLRMIMLSLGFPARDLFEQKAQRAMHKFHALLLRSVAKRTFRFIGAVASVLALPLSLLFILLAFVMVPKLAAIFLALCTVCGGVGCLGAYFGRERDFSKRLSLMHDSDLSEKAAAFCEQGGVANVPVFIDAAQPGIYGGLHYYPHTLKIVLSRSAACSPDVIHQGILAHEFGHLMLPFDNTVTSLDGYRVLYAREFAADAIGACLLRDARPIISCLFEIWEYTPVERRYVLRLGGVSHPPLLERIRVLGGLTHAM